MQTLKEAQDACPLCLSAGYLSFNVPATDPRFGRLIKCQCTIAWERARGIEVLQSKSNLPPRQKTQRFRDWIHQGNQNDKTAEIMERYALDPQSKSIMLHGPKGSGKTMLASSAINARLEVGLESMFYIVPNLLDHLRSTFHPESQIRTDELFDSIKSVQFLVLDELRTEGAKNWALEKMYQLLNDRYNDLLPTVITSNVEVDNIDPIVRSRIIFSGMKVIHMEKSK